MKKLMLLLAVFSATVLQAYSVDNLEKAIRDIDVQEVRYIVSCQAFTQQDKVRLSVLADEIVRNRESWTRKREIYQDVSIPNTKWSDMVKVLAELLGGYCLMGLSGAAAEHMEDRGISYAKLYGLGIGVSGIALACKGLCDAFKADEKQRALLRKKYEDALTIQQLVYSVDVI